MLTSLAHLIVRRKLVIVGIWTVLTVFGAFAAGQVSKRWLEQFSIPGYSAYEANQRTIKTFGTGAQPPLVVTFSSSAGDITQQRGIADAVAAGAAANPGSRASSYFTTQSSAYVSKDGHTTIGLIYPAGVASFGDQSTAKHTLDAVRSKLPAGVEAHITGQFPLQEASGGSEGPSVMIEALVGGIGAFFILLFVFGTLPAVLMPLVVAVAAIMNTFTLVWALTYVTQVSVIVQFLVALVGLGVAIDYALLMIFRFREELSHGETVEDALVETMKHAGRSVIVSGSTVAIGLVSMVIIPVPVIRSIGIGGLLIPLVSVIAAITLLPALLAIMGHRINSLRVLPKRMVDSDRESPFWRRWANLVIKRPIPLAIAGIAIVVLLLIPAVQMNPSDAEARFLPGTGDPVIGRTVLQNAGISPGVIKPFEILIEGNSSQAAADAVVKAVAATPGIAGAAAPAGWVKGDTRIVEAFSAYDGSSRKTRPVISALQDTTLPAAATALGAGTRVTLGGVAPEERDFVHAVYGKFPWVLLFVIVLTYLLLMRAFRSVLLPLKAVLLNLVSLGAAFGIIVFIFQQGHLSEAIWNVHATQAIISWIPLMIFAFLYGLSMDYEVFMLTRMREAYDETGDTPHAVALGLARTGKLVTSAALVLMFAFFVLSTSGGSVDIKQFGVGLAAGIIFDATVIRALLVPALMQLMGRWNWWLPAPIARVLRLDAPKA